MATATATDSALLRGRRANLEDSNFVAGFIALSVRGTCKLESDVEQDPRVV